MSSLDHKLVVLSLLVWQRACTSLQPIRVRLRLLWVGTDERGSDPESALSGRTGGCAGHQHRLGQEAARMEIRPDRFKAAAAKTLGKINRYTPFKLYSRPHLRLSSILRACPGLFCGPIKQFNGLLFLILLLPNSCFCGKSGKFPLYSVLSKRNLTVDI